MEKKNKIILAIVIISVIIVIAICGYSIYKHNDRKVLSDAEKFKNEYEVFNGLVNSSNNKNYIDVNVDTSNDIIYKTDEEILDILKNEEAIIYFGFANCPWCRNIIEPLLSASNKKKIKVYYVDIYEIRDAYIISENTKPKRTKKGSNAYYQILDFLDDNLEEYYINSEDGNKYDTGVKRLYAPTVVAVSKGQVTGIHEGTIEEQTDPYIELSSDEKKKLEDIFIKLIDSIKEENICNEKDAC